jgi:AraC-like DNA-binding protein
MRHRTAVSEIATPQRILGSCFGVEPARAQVTALRKTLTATRLSIHLMVSQAHCSFSSVSRTLNDIFSVIALS